MSPSPWFQRLSPRPDAALRLFCFHHAGGSAALFRLWPRRLPDFDVCAAQLPGRANRLCEPALDSVPALVEAIVPEMLPLLDRPYALFGHSMGSALAAGLAHRLRELGVRMPEHLFVSGRQPPHLQYPDWTLRGLDDAQVLEAVARCFGGFPPEFASHPELIELMMPALRADLEALEAFPPVPLPPLSVPITALGGEADPYTQGEHLCAWQAYTRTELRTRHFPGGHFYIDEELEGVAALLRDTLASAAPPAAWRSA